MDKFCKWCGKTKDIEDFYPLQTMKDGHLNKCKECVKGYEQSRQGTDARRRSQYKWNHKNMASIGARAKKWVLRNPEKKKAHNVLWGAITNGKIVRQKSCNRCGSQRNIQAHHHDYTKPLDVEWLCATCHKHADKERKS